MSSDDKSYGKKVIECNALGEGMTNFNAHGGEYILYWKIHAQHFQVNSLKIKYIECIKPQDSKHDEISLHIMSGSNTGEEIVLFEDDQTMRSGDQWYINYEFDDCTTGIAIQIRENDSNSYSTVGAGILQCDTIGEHHLYFDMANARYNIYWEVTNHNSNSDSCNALNCIPQQKMNEEIFKGDDY